MRSVGMPFTLISAREVSHTQPDNNPIPMSTSLFHVDPARRAGKRILSVPSTVLRAGLPALALVAFLAACDSNDSDDFNISTYTGDAYTGEARGEATTPDGEVSTFLVVNASAQVDSLGEGQARFTVSHSGVAHFSGEGSYNANGASFLDGEHEIEIEGDGDIRGDVSIFGLASETDLEADVDGRITSSDCDFEAFVELTEEFEGYPVGTEIRVMYTLSR